MAHVKLLIVCLLHVIPSYQMVQADSMVEPQGEAEELQLATLVQQVQALQHANAQLQVAQREAQREQHAVNAALHREVARLHQLYQATPVAFSAFPSEPADYDEGITVIFDGIVTNIGGSYDSETNIFTCPSDGLYLFSLSVESNDGSEMNANIVKEGGLVLLNAYAGAGGIEQGSTTVLTECLALEQVWVESAADGGSLQWGRESSFSGVLITPYV